MAASSKTQYQIPVNFIEVDQTGMKTPKPSEGMDPRYLRFVNNRPGGSLQVSYSGLGDNNDPGVCHKEKWGPSGAGIVCAYDDGVEKRFTNGVISGTDGGNLHYGNGVLNASYHGAQGIKSASSTRLFFGPNGDHGGELTRVPQTIPARGTVKETVAVSNSNVNPGDRCTITVGKHGVLAVDYIAHAVGGAMTLSATETAALTSYGDLSLGSHNGCTQLGGKGLIMSCQVGPLSIMSKSSQMSIYTKGSPIVIDAGGGPVYINSGGVIPTDAAVAAVKQVHRGNVIGPKVRNLGPQKWGTADNPGNA